MAVLVIAAALVATHVAIRDGFAVARAEIDEATGLASSPLDHGSRHGQALVEVLVVLPLLAVIALGLFAGWLRLGDVARAERALGATQAALASGEALPPISPADGLRREIRRDRITIRVDHPLIDVVVEAPIPARP